MPKRKAWRSKQENLLINDKQYRLSQPFLFVALLQAKYVFEGRSTIKKNLFLKSVYDIQLLKASVWHL